MKKRLYLMTALGLTICLACGAAMAENTSGAFPLPEGMPANYLEYEQVGGTKTNGVTFVLTEARCEGREASFRVMQLPNDGDASLVDNQTEHPAGDPDETRDIEEAAQYGDQILGTLCDIATITDEQGNNLLKEYRIQCDRDGAALIYEFSFELPPESEPKEVHVELALGVNEDLSCRFEMTGGILLSIPVEQATGA